MNKLTVVIPSKNEGYRLIKCLKLLEQQTITFDVIVADSSDDNFSMLNLHIKNKENIKLIEGGLPSIARNKGFDLVQTPYVLFLDADMMIYDKTLLEVCLDKMKNYELLSCKIRCDDKKYDWLWNGFHFIQYILPETFILGGFQMWKTEKFIECGKFDEEAKVAEDWLLTRKVSKNKSKIINRHVYTSGRRFDNKGVFWMYIFMIKCWINKKNKNWFNKSHNYWS